MKYTFLTALLLSTIIFQNSNLIAQLNWEEIPLPYGGTVNVLCENQIGLFAGTPTGLYRSTDTGDSWTLTSNEAYFGYESRLFVHSSGRIFLSDGWGYSRFQSSGELIASDDNFRAVSFAEDNGGNIYCITQFDGLYVSADTGQTWNQFAYEGVYGFRLIWIDSNGTIYLAGEEKLAVSSNNGATWNELEYDWNSPVDFVEDSNGTIYLFFEYYEKMLKKELNGEWEESTYDHHGYLSFCDATINDKDEIIVSAGYDGVWISKDFCETWEQLGDVDYNHNDICITASGKIYVGVTYKGVYEYDPSTNEWTEKCNGLPAYVACFIITPAGNYIMSTGAYLYTSNDEGQNWIKGDEIYYNCRFYKDRTTSTYYRYNYPDMMQSSDDGVTWSEINFQRPDGGISDFAIRHEEVIYISSHDRLLRSFNNGVEWDIIWERDTIYSHYYNSPYELTASDNGEINFIFTKFIYRSFDYGNNWFIIDPEALPLPDYGDGWSIRFFRKSAWGNLYVVVGNALFEQTADYCWRKIYDAGRRDSGTYNYIIDLDFGPNNQMFIIVDNQLLASSDFGKTWEAVYINDDLYRYNILITDNQIYSINEYSIKKAQVQLEDIEIPKKSYLLNNYPNPFNNQTTIEFFVDKPGQVKLVIYNSIGQVVDEIVNNYTSNGIYTVTWNADNNASGVYFIRLLTNEFSEVRKMVLIK